jgi:PEP-CTERM motif
MVSKKFVFFAVGSMFVAGATLASNVSFGQRAARWVSQNMDFMGPVSGLVNAVVRSADFGRSNPVLSFQVQGESSVGSALRAGQATEIAAYRGQYGNYSAVGGGDSLGGYIGRLAGDRSSDVQAANALLGAGAGTRFQAIVGENDSALNRLAKDFLRKGSLADEKDLWSILNGRDGLKQVGDTNAFSIGGGSTASGPASATSDIPMILAAATNGDSLVSSTAVVGSAIESQLEAQTKPNQTATTQRAGQVPVPGSLILLGVGLLALAVRSKK